MQSLNARARKDIGMPIFKNNPKNATLLFMGAAVFLATSPVGAAPNKSVNPEPDFSSSAYRATTEEKHDEQAISSCDQKADQAKVSESDRMDFIRLCLETDARTHG
jgi:hypothetical protein